MLLTIFRPHSFMLELHNHFVGLIHLPDIESGVRAFIVLIAKGTGTIFSHQHIIAVLDLLFRGILRKTKNFISYF